MMKDDESKDDKKKFSETMKACSTIYPFSLTPEVMKIFWITLKKYKIEIILSAFSKYLANSKNLYFPKPAQLIEIIEGKKEDRCLIAWSKAFNAKLDFGSSRSVVFDDFIIHDVISDFGGWIKFCDIVHNEKSLSFTQREFIRRYEGYLDGWSARSPKVLLGGDAINRIRYNQQHTQGDGNWQPLPKPNFVGDIQKSQDNFLKIKEIEKLKLSHSGELSEDTLGIPTGIG